MEVDSLRHVSGTSKIYTRGSRFVGYVHLTVNSPGEQRLKRFKPEDLIRSAEWLYTDSLLLDNAVHLLSSQTQPVWIAVKVSAEAKPGSYRGNIRIITDAGTFSVPFRLDVYPAQIPETLHFWMGGLCHGILAQSNGPTMHPLDISR